MENQEQLERTAKFLNISLDQLVGHLGMLKAEKGDGKSPGTAGGTSMLPLKALLESQLELYTSRGIKEQFSYIPDYKLRKCEERNPIISTIINTRCRQIRAFSQSSKDTEKPGFRIRMKNEEKNPTKDQRKEMAWLEEWFYNTGRNDFPEAIEREDNLLDVMQKTTREYYTIDKVAIELRRDKRDRLVDFWAVDGATIKRVVPGGYRGTESDFDPRAIMMNDEFSEKLAQSKIDNLPPKEEIRFVQEIDGRLCAAFRQKDLIFDFMSKRVDVRYAGYGYSCTEQAMNVITAFLFALAYNSQAFNGATIPKIGLAFESGDFDTDALKDLQEEWLANFSGVQGAYRIPMLNGRVSVLDFLKSNRDMEYQKFLEFTASLTGSIFGFDLMEAGLKFFSTTNALTENSADRQQFSKDRGLIDLLGTHANVNNKILRMGGWADQYIFEFTGLDPKDREFEQKNKSERVKTYMTVDEIRAEDDLPPLPDGMGQVILDPTYLQFVQMKTQNQDQGAPEVDDDMGGYGDVEDDQDNGPMGGGDAGSAGGDMDGALDEALDDLGKAQTPIRARTLLVGREL
ncbi:MAG: hypothetical protein M0Z75_13740 [Nitrospiraceae bacterium]|nr:hypothetical protein [Nitrospiraceae bacterium]